MEININNLSIQSASWIFAHAFFKEEIWLIRVWMRMMRRPYFSSAIHMHNVSSSDASELRYRPTNDFFPNAKKPKCNQVVSSASTLAKRELMTACQSDAENRIDRIQVDLKLELREQCNCRRVADCLLLLWKTLQKSVTQARSGPLKGNTP